MSPYPGIPKEKTGAMETCIKSVLAKHSGDKGFDKSNAIAICHSSIMGGLMLEPVTQDDLAQYGEHEYFASVEGGELLRFKDALLCRAGTNKNRDWINEQGIRELAETMAFMPIDDEHQQDMVIGFFVNPRTANDDTELYTDGIVYSRRFSEIVEKVRSGEKKLSVEAGASIAECSLCGEKYSSRKDYCEHLKDKFGHNAERKLYGLKAKGGATVFHPAWDTSFDQNGFVMIASQMEFDKPNDIALSLWAKIANKLDSYLRKHEVDQAELAATIDEGGATMVNVDELNLEELGLVQASEAETLKTDLEAKLADSQAETEKLKVGLARILEMGLTANDIEVMANLSDKAYKLFQDQQKEEPKEEVKVEASEEGKPEPKKEVVLEGGEVETTAPLTWETANLKVKEV